MRNSPRSVMAHNVRQTNILVKRECAPGDIGESALWRHYVRMANDGTKNYLREWRKAKGYSLVQLGELVGKSHGQLSKIENGKHPWSQDLLEQLAKIYGCGPIDLLVSGPADQPNIFSIWHKANASQKREIADIADIVLKRAS